MRHLASPRFSYLLILPLSGAALAQTPQTLETVTVVSTATRTEQPIEGVSATVQVIDQQQIEKIGAQTLKDIFQRTPGLALQYGSFPSASAASKSSVSLRGVGATGTLWLLDGRRLAGEVKNPYDMDRIPAASIERIEIVKGPMSALYGADAVGGVINIVSKKPEAGETQGSVSLSHGANADGDGANSNLSANVRGGSDKARYSLNFSHQDATPYTETETTQTRLGSPATPPPLANAKDSYDVPVSYREEAEVSTVSGRIEWLPTTQTTLGLEANHFEEEREGTYRGNFHPTGFSPAPGQRVPAFDVPVRSRDDNQRTDIAFDVQHKANEQWDLKGRVYQSKYEKRNSTTMTEYADFAYPSEAASSASGMTANVTIQALEGSATWYSPDDQHVLTGGVEIRDEEREASVFTQSDDLTTRQVGSQALYLQDEWAIDRDLTLTLGGRYDKYTQDAYTDALGTRHDESNDSESTFRIGLSKALRPQLHLRANVAQGYRVPDIRELYIQKQTPAGLQLGALTIDPARGKTAYDLQPESTNAFEIGLRGQNGALRYDVAVFYNEISDRIEQTQVGTGQTAYYTFQNVSKANTRGVEFQTQYDITPNWQAQFAWSELDTENKDTGQELALTPKRDVSLGLDWKINDRLSANANLVHTGEQTYFENERAITADSHTLLHLGSQYALDAKQRWQLTAGIRNVTDESIEKRLGSDPGTTFYFGLRGKL